MYLTVSSVPSDFIHIYVLLTNVKDKSGKKTMQSYEHKNEWIASLCELYAPAPARPDTHHRESFQQEKAHCYRAPCYHRNSFHSKKFILYYGQL